jgi:CDGSH-type Zn-finger protein
LTEDGPASILLNPIFKYCIKVQGRNKGDRMGKITITKDGPYVVSGNLPLCRETIIRGDKGFSEKYEKGKKFPAKESYSLCRCGMSSKGPYCDGAHLNPIFGGTKFDGTETASRKPYLEQADRIDGPAIMLTDQGDLCFGAGFCHGEKGDVWHNTRDSDNKDSKEIAVKQACNCTSGRLVAWDKKTGAAIAIEPEFAQSISLIEEPAKGASGPIWVKGKILLISSDGKAYEVRNRVTLCRCGSSNNKPFCDGSHVTEGFREADNQANRKR